MAVTEHTIIINKPIDLVFRNVTCMRGCVNWITGIMSAEKIGDEPVQVGTQYKETYKFMGLTGEALATVQIYNPPYEFAFVDSIVPVDYHYTFEEVSGGTRVHTRVTLTPRDTGNLDPEVVVARVAKQFDSDLDNLKHMLEADVLVQVD